LSLPKGFAVLLSLIEPSAFAVHPSLGEVEHISRNIGTEMPESDGIQSVQQYKPDTLAIHADDKLNFYTDVAPALHVSTTFRYNNANLAPTGDEEVSMQRH
jgi:hypothetical protein